MADMGTLQHGRTTYEVETVEDDGKDRERLIPYRLIGARGAKYLCVRNAFHPDKLLLINERNFSGSTPFEWVHEKAPGVLEVIR